MATIHIIKNERQLRRLRQQQLYTTQQKEIARLEEMIERFERWAKQVLSRKHMLAARQRRRMLTQMEERGEIIDKVFDTTLMDFKVSGWRGSKKVLELVDVAMVFPTTHSLVAPICCFVTVTASA